MILVGQGRIPAYVREITNFRPHPLSTDGIFLKWNYENEGGRDPEEMTITYMEATGQLKNIRLSSVEIRNAEKATHGLQPGSTYS